METIGLIYWENDYWASKMPLKVVKLLLPVAVEEQFSQETVVCKH